MKLSRGKDVFQRSKNWTARRPLQVWSVRSLSVLLGLWKRGHNRWRCLMRITGHHNKWHFTGRWAKRCQAMLAVHSKMFVQKRCAYFHLVFWSDTLKKRRKNLGKKTLIQRRDTGAVVTEELNVFSENIGIWYIIKAFWFSGEFLLICS